MSQGIKRRSREDIQVALRHQWFPVARTVDLDRPVEAELLGERLVVYRTADGGPRVLQRRCVHRGANLAKGEVHGDVLACPYHGWQFDGTSGRCTHVPSLTPEAAKRIPSTARVAAYPAVEHWGHVWTCLEEPVGGLPDPPEFAELELGEWVAGPVLHSTIGLAATTENFRDVAHFPFVHRGTMGEVPHVVEPLDVRRDGVEVWMTRRVEAQDGASEWSDDGDAWMRYHTIAPGVSIIVYEYDDIGKRVLFGIPAPIGPDECTIFWGVANDASFQGHDGAGGDGGRARGVPRGPAGGVRPRPARGVVRRLAGPRSPSPPTCFTLNYRRAFLAYVDAALASRNGAPSLAR